MRHEGLLGRIGEQRRVLVQVGVEIEQLERNGRAVVCTGGLAAIDQLAIADHHERMLANGQQRVAGQVVDWIALDSRRACRSIGQR